MERKLIKRRTKARVGLNFQDEKFISIWMANKCTDAKGAYIEAGFRARGNSAEVGAWQLMRKPHVKAEIQRRVNMFMKPYDVTTKSIIRELVRIGYSDPGKIYNENGSIMTVPEMDVATRAAIASVEVKEIIDSTTGLVVAIVTKVRFWNKPEALSMLGRYKGLFVDKVALDVRIRGGVLLVPATVPLDQWEEWAKRQQRELLENEGDIIDIDGEDEED